MEAFAMTIVRFFLATIFLLSGIAKWRARDVLADIVVDYRFLPPSLAVAVASLLPFLESLVGVALFTNLVPGAAALLAAAMAFTFAIATFLNVRRGRSIACGCFGVSSAEKVTWATVARALSLSVMASGVAFADLKSATPSILVGFPSGALGSAAISGTVLAVSYLLITEWRQMSRSLAQAKGEVQLRNTAASDVQGDSV